MTCVELFSDVLNECAQFFSAVEPSPPVEPSSPISTPAPDPISTAPSTENANNTEDGASNEEDDSDDGNDWLPLWTAIIGAGAVLAGTWLTQFFSSRNEKARLTAQNAREDTSARREELKLVYAELVGLLGAMVQLSIRHNAGKEARDAVARLDRGSPGREELLTKTETLAESRVDNMAEVITKLTVVDLLEEDEVYFFAYKYMTAVGDLDGDDEKFEIAKAWGDLMKLSMRASLRGERLPAENGIDHYRALEEAKKANASKESPADPEGDLSPADKA